MTQVEKKTVTLRWATLISIVGSTITITTVFTQIGSRIERAIDKHTDRLDNHDTRFQTNEAAIRDLRTDQGKIWVRTNELQTQINDLAQDRIRR